MAKRSNIIFLRLSMLVKAQFCKKNLALVKPNFLIDFRKKRLFYFFSKNDKITFFFLNKNCQK